MSSFVISKKEYIKAAGFFAGVAECQNYYREPVIYWYSYSKRGLLNAEDYKKAFSKLFEMNARSVQLQYHDADPFIDANEYTAEFKKYYVQGRKLYIDATLGSVQPFKNAVFDFLNFTHSINYQIEDRRLADSANKFMHKCNSFLLGVLPTLEHYDSECWSRFSLFDDEEV